MLAKIDSPVVQNISKGIASAAPSLASSMNTSTQSRLPRPPSSISNYSPLQAGKSHMHQGSPLSGSHSGVGMRHAHSAAHDAFAQAFSNAGSSGYQEHAQAEQVAGPWPTKAQGAEGSAIAGVVLRSRHTISNADSHVRSALALLLMSPSLCCDCLLRY